MLKLQTTSNWNAAVYAVFSRSGHILRLPTRGHSGWQLAGITERVNCLLLVGICLTEFSRKINLSHVEEKGLGEKRVIYDKYKCKISHLRSNIKMAALGVYGLSS